MDSLLDGFVGNDVPIAGRGFEFVTGNFEPAFN